MDYDKMNVFIAIFLFSAARGIFVRSETGDTCEDNNGKSGTCISLAQCASAIDDIKNKGQHPKICAFEGIDPIVCCIDTPKASNVLPDISDVKQPSYNSTQTNISNSTSTRVLGEISRAKCKEYTKYSYRYVLVPVLTIVPEYRKIYECNDEAGIFPTGSVKAGRKEFPHMAHIGYRKKKEIMYNSAGSLISERFVLMAGHALDSYHLGPPVLVRFGITNVNNMENMQVRKVLHLFPYPAYKESSFYHDIGLLELQEPVEINSFVRPACLNSVKDMTVQTAVLSGWGPVRHTVQSSGDLSRSIMKIFSTEACNQTFRTETINPKIDKGIVEDWMICAGITSHQRKDACQGDSGSPLQLHIQDSKESQCMYSIIGVTSFGRRCGEVNTPGVFTRVSAYIKWLEDTVWPENSVI